MKEISAGGVVFYEKKDNIYLLMIEDKCRKWTFPKGKVEQGETYMETAIREVYEETGIAGEIVQSLDKVYYEYYQPVNNKVEKTVYYYLVKANTYDVKVQLSEINSAQWITLNEAWEKQRLYGYDNNMEVMIESLKKLGYLKFGGNDEWKSKI